jgi:serine/threonine-protein kinase
MEAPHRFGQYKVLGVLHAGKHSNIYHAEGPGGERVAVKTIDPRVASRNHLSERFLRGARAAAATSSPYLVKVLDVGMLLDSGHLWCAMELIEGETLSSRIAKRGRRPYDRSDATRIASQIARALYALHRSGVVHRNVKPGNVMLTPKNGFDHFVTVVGMGLVRPLEQDRSVELTSRGAVIGTPAYLAPEALIDSTQVDETADIYSLGVVLYELLSGKLPFPGTTVIEQLVQKQEGTKPLETAPSLRRLLVRMLAADRKRRPQNMGEVIDILGESIDEETNRDESTRAEKVHVNLEVSAQALARPPGKSEAQKRMIGRPRPELSDESERPTIRVRSFDAPVEQISLHEVPTERLPALPPEPHSEQQSDYPTQPPGTPTDPLPPRQADDFDEAATEIDPGFGRRR